MSFDDLERTEKAPDVQKDSTASAVADREDREDLVRAERQRLEEERQKEEEKQREAERTNKKKLDTGEIPFIKLVTSEGNEYGRRQVLQGKVEYLGQPEPGDRSQAASGPSDKTSVDQDVTRLDEALSVVTVDAEDISEILAGKSKAERDAIAKAYEDKTGVPLESALSESLEGEELEEALHVLKRSDEERAADDIYAACEGLGADAKAISEALKGKTPAQIKEIEDYYRETYEIELKDHLKDELTEKEYKDISKLLGGAPEGKENASKGDSKAATGDKVAQGVKGKDASPENGDSKPADGKKGKDASPENGDSRPADGKDHSEQWGKRTITVHPDGSAEYTVKKGDTLGSIAKDILEHKHPGHKPTNKEILQEVQKLAKDSHIKDPNKIFVGDKIVIAKDPASAEKPKPVEKPTEKPSDKPAEPPKVPEKPIDRAEMEKAAAEIRKATEKDDKIDTGTNEKAIYNVLEGKTKAEREEIAKLYQEKYKISLEAELKDEMSGDELERALYLLRRQDTPTPKGVDSAEMTKAAEAIFQAADGPGTNEKAIYEALQGKSKDEIAEMNRIYQAKHGKTLEAELRDELSGLELDKALNLLKGKDGEKAELPASVDKAAMEKKAEEIWKATADKTGTDEDAVFNALKGLTKDERKALDAIYKEKHGVTLTQQFQDEMSGEDLNRALTLLNKGDAPAADSPEAKVDRAAMEKRADDFWKAGGDQVGTDEKEMIKALKGLTEAERKVMNDIYQEKHGKTLAKEIEDELSGTDKQQAENLLFAKDGDAKASEKAIEKVDKAKIEERVEAIFKAGQDKTGTDEKAIHEALKGTTKAEREAMDALYKEKHGLTLSQIFKDEMSGDDYDNAMKLLNSPGVAGSEITPDSSPATNPAAKEPEIDTSKVDREKIAKVAADIRKATEKDDTVDTGTDEKVIFKALEGLSDADRKVLKEIYKDKYKVELADEIKDEMDGEEEAKALALLDRRDTAFTTKGVNANSMEKAAEGIFEACDGPGTEKEKIYKILEGKTEAEKKMINEFYKTKYGRTLKEEFEDEMSGADLDKALNLLNKKDGSADDAGRIHTALIERDQLIEGRSDANCEKDIRDTLATMNSEQIAQLDKDYQARYGKTLRQALMEDENLSTKTKEAIDIYLKGSDKRTTEDTLKLTDIALENKDKDMFMEAMRSASPEARKAFMDNGGDAKMKDAFDGVFTDTDYKNMKDYAEKGGLSTATKIKDNTSWTGDNEKAIEKALGDMKQEERDAYKKGKELVEKGADEATLSEADKKAVQTYKEIHQALVDAGNDAEIARWEDMINVKGGSLISKLMAHRGSIYDDNMDDIIGDIEKMSKSDWERLKKDPNYRKELEDGLRSYLSPEELKRCMDVIDKKAAAKTFEEASTAGNRPILEALNDAKHWHNDNEENIYAAIKNMSPEEQKKYKEDPEFRKQVDEKVKSILDSGAEQDAAFRMLKQIEEGKKPTEDIITKLNMQAGKADTDEAQVIRDLKKAFQDDPTLRDRINNPKTEEDRKFAEEFKKALHKALDDSEYEKYAKPLLEKGFLPMDVQMELNKGVTDDDEKGAFNDLVALAKDKSPEAKEEREKILKDKDYQDKVLGFLNADERAIALNALKQGAMKPEDELRAAMVGAGTDEDKIKEVMGKLTPQQLEEVKNEYSRKYGRDLTADLIDELGGQDKVDALRLAERPAANAREAFNRERDKYYESYDGIGKGWVNGVWDGTGYMSEDAMNEFSSKMTEFSAKFQELPLEQQKELTDKLRNALDLFRESKGAAADALVDVAIAVVAVVGAFFTEGVSLTLLAATGFGAALFKVAAKTLIMGADYELSMAGLDAATGFVDGFLAFLGPGELASLLKVGARGAEVAATQAGKQLVKELGEVAAKEAIKGGEAALEKAMTKAVRDAMVSGSKTVDDKVIERMVKELAQEGASEAQKTALRKALKEGLDVGMKEATAGMSKVELLAMKHAFIAGGGALGGGGSGMIRGFAEWDTNKSFADNMATVGKVTAMSAGFGAAGGLAFAAVFEVGGAVSHGIREHFKVKPGEKLTQAQLDEAAKLMGVKEGKLRQDDQGRLILEGKSEKPPSHGDKPVSPNDGPNGPHDAPNTPKDSPTLPKDAPQIPKDVQVTNNSDGTITYIVDGKPVTLEQRGGFFYPRRGPNDPVPDVDMMVKVHVATNGPQDMGKLQAVLLKEMQNDPELARLIQEWKTINPNYADPTKLPPGVEIGKGQGEKAFTLYAKSPEDALLLQKKLDEILSKYPELKLDSPVNPKALDQFSGATNRVGVVRDFYTPTEIGTEVKLDPAKELEMRQTLNKKPGEKFTPEDLATIEQYTGMKLRFDDGGNLLVKETGARLDDALTSKIHERYKVEPGQKLSDAQLREVEAKTGLKEGTLVYDSEGKLALKGTPGESRNAFGRYYMSESGAEAHPRGEKYLVKDPETGKMVEVTSGGITDRPAIYKLGDEFGVHPLDGVRPMSTGDKVKVNGQEVEVINQDGKMVAVRKPGKAGEVEGAGIPEGSYDLNKFKPIKVGDDTYYFRPEDGTYHRLNSKKELVEDFDVEFVTRDKLGAKAATSPSDTAPPTLRSAGSDDAPTEPKREKVSDNTPRVDKDAPVEAGFKDTGLTDNDGNKILFRSGKHDVPGKGPITIDPKNPPEGMTPIKIGTEAAYRDADGNVYRQLRLDNGTLKPGTYTPDGNYKVEIRGKGTSGDHVPPTKRSGHLGDDSPTVRYDDPTTVRYDEPTTVRYEDPTTVRYEDPTTVRYEDPTTVRYEGSTTVRYDEPTTVRFDEPTTVRYNEPVTVRYEAGTTVTVDGPNGPQKITYNEPTTVRYDQPTTVRYDGPTTVKYDGPATVRYDAPTTVRYDDPVTVRYDDPVTIRYEDPTTIRYDDPTTVRYEDPTTVRYEDPNKVIHEDPSQVTTEIDPFTGEPITWRSGNREPDTVTPREKPERVPESRGDSKKLPREAAEDPTMDWAEISPEKRAEMVERAKRSELYKAENVDDFVARAKDVTSKWDDRSELTRNFDKAHKDLIGAYGNYQTEVFEPMRAVLQKMGKSPDEIKGILGNTDEVRKLLNNEDVRKLLNSEEIKKAFPGAHGPEEQLKAVDRLAEARTKFTEQNKAIEAAVKERTEQIQKLMDQYADDHGLSRVKVRLVDEVGANGTYDNGILSISRSDVLAAKDPSKLIDTMYHEMVHNEQDSLVIRHLAEKQKVAHPPSQHDLDQLEMTYELETGRKISPEHLKEALRAKEAANLQHAFNKETGAKLTREQLDELMALNKPEQIKKLQELSGGKLSAEEAGKVLDNGQNAKLSEKETARAEELIKDQQKNPWPGEKVTEWNNDVRVARSELAKLEADPGEAYRLIGKIVDDKSGTLAKRLFGDSIPPEVQHLIDIYKDPNKTFPGDGASTILKKRISEEIGVREAMIKDEWQRYFDNPDEQEAWLVGKRAGIAARESGIAGTDQPPAVVKDLDPHPERPKRTTLPGIGKEGDTLPGVGAPGKTSPESFAPGDSPRVVPRLTDSNDAYMHLDSELPDGHPAKEYAKQMREQMVKRLRAPSIA